MRAQSLLLYLGIVLLLAAGCGAEHEETLSVDMGTAEVRVDIAQFAESDITRVSVEAAGITQDLMRDPNTTLFAGVVLLPAGTHNLVARAYAGTTEVGVSNPTSVIIQAGAVTGVTIRILDTTGGYQPTYGPIIESLTYPMSAEVGAAVTLAISVVDPDNDPISIAWTDTCTDSMFTAPQSATTGWSKASQGSCEITVTATANGQSVAETFSIVVFPAGSGSGAADVDGVFVPAPQLSLWLAYDSASCSVGVNSGNNGSCPRSIASPSVASLYANVSWGNSNPGTLEVFDSCGGLLRADYQDLYFWSGSWVPPVQGTVCFVSARATTSEGVQATLSAAVLVRNGTPRVIEAPQFSAEISSSSGICNLLGGGTALCGQLLMGEMPYATIMLDWRNGLPGTVQVTDDCGGSFQMGPPMGTEYYQGAWRLPPLPGIRCNLTVTATNQEGLSTLAVGTFDIR